MKIFFKKYLILLKLIFVIGSFFFLVSNVQAASFKINKGDVNWEISSDGIYKNGVQIACSDIQIGPVPDPALEKGFLIKNDNGDRLLLITEDYIYTTAKNSFTSLTYPASLFNSFIIKDSNNDIFLYVNNSGLYYKDSMCIEAICGNNEIEPGEECDDNLENSPDCGQSTSRCNTWTTMKGVRDEFGSCSDTSCQCEDDVFDYSCVVDECEAVCDEDLDCDESNGYGCVSCQCHFVNSCEDNDDCLETEYCASWCHCSEWSGDYQYPMPDELLWGDTSCAQHQGDPVNYCGWYDPGAPFDPAWFGTCWGGSYVNGYCKTDCTCGERDYWGIRPDNQCDPSNPGCFKAGTKILTPKGEINIEEIKAGDIVYSYDNGNLVETKVVKLWIHEDYKDPAGILRLTNGINIDVTLNHPFYDVDQNEYKELRDFAFNEELVYFDLKLKKFQTTRIIGFEKTDYFYLEYNLHLEKYHNFLANGVVVHNADYGGGKYSSGGVVE